MKSQTRTYVAEVAKNVRFVELSPELKGIVCVNAPPIEMDEVLKALMKAFGDSIALGWWLQGDGRVRVQVRTRAHYDASAIASAFGGRGDKTSAHFQIGLAQWVKVVAP